MNSQITSHNRPAVAALLIVLSASAVLAQVNSVSFKGAFDERDTGVVQFPNLTSMAAAPVLRRTSADSPTLTK
jgi:hypothetical protein